MGLIVREKYIDRIEKYLGKDYIIVLVGQRRVGKSSILKTISSQKCESTDNNVIYIDKEKERFDFIRNYIDLRPRSTKFVNAKAAYFGGNFVYL
jgi:hypothetical protein